MEDVLKHPMIIGVWGEEYRERLQQSFADTNAEKFLEHVRRVEMRKMRQRTRESVWSALDETRIVQRKAPPDDTGHSAVDDG